MNKKILMVVRESYERHPVLRVLHYSGLIDVSLNIKAKPMSLYRVLFWRGRFIVSDPLIAMLCFWREYTFYSLEMFEFQVENTCVRNLLRNKLFSVTHMLALKMADKIVFPNKVRASYYQEKYGLLSDKITIKPNYPSISTIEKLNSLKVDPLRKKDMLSDFLESKGVDVDIKNKKIFVYIGSINERNRGAGSIRDAVMKEDDSFLIYAGKQTGISLEVGEVDCGFLYLGELTHEDALKLVSFADVGILYYSTELKNTNYCAPVKLFEYLNADLEILSNKAIGLKEYSEAIAYFIGEDGKLIPNKNLSTAYIERLKGVSYEGGLSGSTEI